jgi:hypothetical protein
VGILTIEYCLAKQIPHNYQSPRRWRERNSKGDLLACSKSASAPGVATMRPAGNSGIVGNEFILASFFLFAAIGGRSERLATDRKVNRKKRIETIEQVVVAR